uniref:hypothetical protein n=1 Tax=Flavobacterium sp. TaxID=239 RepID=UPI00404A07D3
MEHHHFFLLVWFIWAVSIISFFFIKGRKELERFPKIDNSNFEYIENSLSGYSYQSFVDSKKVIRVRITKNELWITSSTFMAFIAKKFDLLHMIPIETLKSVKKDGTNVIIEFSQNGYLKKIVLVSKKQNELVKLLHDKMSKK